MPRAVARDPFTGVQIRVGVMGSAGEPVEPTVAAVSRRLGRAIAERRCCLLTGACPGLPHEAVLGAKELDGHIVGISPAATLREHVETFGSPYREYEVLIFTGLRNSELARVRLQDVDLDQCHIRVVQGEGKPRPDRVVPYQLSRRAPPVYAGGAGAPGGTPLRVQPSPAVLHPPYPPNHS